MNGFDDNFGDERSASGSGSGRADSGTTPALPVVSEPTFSKTTFDGGREAGDGAGGGRDLGGALPGGLSAPSPATSSSNAQPVIQRTNSSQATASPGPQYCANDPSQVATGFCPELELALCPSSFDNLKRMPAFAHITFVPLHESLQKRRKDPETGEPYALYDLETQEPIPTVAKLVGRSRTHECCSLEAGADKMREAMKTQLTVLKDQLSNARVASTHVDKLIFVVSQEADDRRREVETYFGEFQKKLDQARERVMDELHDATAKKLNTLRQLSERLPLMVASSSEAIDRVQEVFTFERNALELLFRRKEMQLYLDSVGSRLNLGGSDIFQGDVRQTMGRSVTVAKDENFAVYLKGCAQVRTDEKDPELERCWQMVDTLLGHDSTSLLSGATAKTNVPIGPSSSSNFSRTAANAGDGGASLNNPFSANQTAFGGSYTYGGSATSRSRPEGAPLENGKTHRPIISSSSTTRSTPGFGYNSATSPVLVAGGGAGGGPTTPTSAPFLSMPSTTERFPSSSAVSSRNIAGGNSATGVSREFKFDPNYCQEQLVVLRNNNREALRKIPHASSAIAIMSSLLGPPDDGSCSSRVEVIVDELNLFLPNSGWVGATPVRSLTCLQEHAIYLDLFGGEIWREGVLVEKLMDKLSVMEGDRVGVDYLPGSQLQFFLNDKKVGLPIRDVTDLLYPFVNVLGKVLRFRL
ncbi:unnamed protein product [Amoebophrya sp. A25]|nr:unnamed protein product [Amoebophrya sp. A25]|eukprot:GSA25T00017251001.1